MGRRKGQRERAIEGGFTALPHDFIDHEVFRRLSESGIKAYILCQRKVFYRRNANRHHQIFTLTYTEAQRYGLSSSVFRSAIAQLCELGLLDVYEAGGDVAHGYKKATSYQLSERWRQYGTPHFQSRRWGYNVAVHGK
jgi:hypothetical protein